MKILKKALHPLYSFLVGIPGAIRRASIHVKVAIVLLVCAAVVGGFIYANRQTDHTFAKDYAAYANIAAQGDNAAYIPGAENNPVRVAIEQALTQILQGQVTDAARLTLSTEGLSLLQQSEAQIGDISSTSAQVDVAIAKMQVDVLNGFAPSAQVAQIIALAKDRESTISDIRAYSYKSDFETEQIFNTIITDKGVLTQAYIVQLNDEIPQVESEFDARSALYTQLQNTAQQIADDYAAVAGLPIPTSGSVTPSSDAGTGN